MNRICGGILNDPEADLDLRSADVEGFQASAGDALRERFWMTVGTVRVVHV